MVNEKHLIFDYGHGDNCPGKCSPDRSFYEWESNRLIGTEVAARMRNKGYLVDEIWTQNHEPLSIPGKMCTSKELKAALNWRTKEVNKYCDKYGTHNCLSVSFHSNAAGADGKWHDSSGFCVMVGLKASQTSKRIARFVYDSAAKRNLQGNRFVPVEHCWPQSLAMCDNTKCPAILIEAMFYDNKSDLALLTSDEGRELITEAIVEGLTKFLESQ